MPSKFKDVEKFFVRIAILESQMKALMVWQKWELTLLAGIILLLIKVVLTR